MLSMYSRYEAMVNDDKQWGIYRKITSKQGKIVHGTLSFREKKSGYRRRTDNIPVKILCDEIGHAYFIKFTIFSSFQGVKQAIYD